MRLLDFESQESSRAGSQRCSDLRGYRRKERDLRPSTAWARNEARRGLPAYNLIEFVSINAKSRRICTDGNAPQDDHFRGKAVLRRGCRERRLWVETCRSRPSRYGSGTLALCRETNIVRRSKHRLTKPYFPTSFTRQKA